MSILQLFMSYSYVVSVFVNGGILEFGHVDFSTRLDGFVFKYIHSVSLRDCWKECDARANCASFNYLPHVLRCELNTKRISDLGANSPTDGKGYIYWEREILLTTVICGVNTCNKAESCDAETNTCHITECPPLLNFQFGDILGNMHDVSSKVLVRCYLDDNIPPSFGATMASECQSDGRWRYQPDQSFTCPPVWKLVFRGTPGIGVDINNAWINGESTVTDDVTCMSHYVTSCTQNYRHPLVDQWSDLSISKVKYSMYRDGSEDAYVIFNGTGSNITNWFSQDRVLASSWFDLGTTSVNYFTMLGHGGRRFLINFEYNGCANDRAYSMILMTNTHGCGYDTHSSYPQFLYASSTSNVLTDGTDFVLADIMAIHIVVESAGDIN